MLTVAVAYWISVAIAMASLAARLRRVVVGALVLLAVALLVFAGGADFVRQRLLARPMDVVVRQENARV